MTQCAMPPIMLTASTASPTSSIITSNNSFLVGRRSSVRRGTISSISKDVRVNDIVEIIKNQKKERNTTIDVLKRRHSMLTIASNKTIVIKQKRMSNEGVVVSPVPQQQQQQQNKQGATADRIRLEPQHQHQQQQQSYACTTTTTEEGETTTTSSSCSSLLSSSTSTTSISSCDSSHHEQQQQQQQQKDPLVKQRETIINELKSCMTNCSNQFNQSDLVNNKKKIHNCKSLVLQQQELLNQLETLCEKPPPSPPYSPTLTMLPKLLSSLLLKPSSTTTSLIIKQKQPDKNELDTIISVQGICTTMESSLIPDKLLYDITSFNQGGIYQFKYSLNMTHQDRQSKFILLPTTQWQKDDDISHCSFKHCHQSFNWFQRKHHCRGCGQIYCSEHSGNRLPLFLPNNTVPVFSRICDTCCFDRLVATDSLYSFV